MRAEGRSRTDIAADFRERYGVNARVAMRWAHDWTQRQVAERWTQLWPDDPKSERNISAWELWPHGGHAPTLPVLDGLARVLTCDITDLLTDLPGYRHFDQTSNGIPVPDLAGIWHSRYTYESGNEERDGQHYVLVEQARHDVVATSLPHTQDSRLKISLMFHPPAATGRWMEWTSPRGRYGGAPYHGSIQFIVDPTGRTMTGRWVGFGRSYAMKDGNWKLTWVAPPDEEQEYRLVL